MHEPISKNELLTIVSPIDGSIVRSLSHATEHDVDKAVEAAKAAQEIWMGITPEQRGVILWKLGTLVEQNAEELAKLDVSCTGKVFRDSLNDSRRGARHARYWAGMADKIYGQQLADVPGRLSYSKRDPLGVYAVVLPWNAPAHSFMARSMPAIACGNAVIVKPSELSPCRPFSWPSCPRKPACPADLCRYWSVMDGWARPCVNIRVLPEFHSRDPQARDEKSWPPLHRHSRR